MSYIIQHNQTETKGEFFIEKDSSKIAEMTYSKAGTDRIIIDHTDILDENFRGKGLGKKLVYEAVTYARKKNIKILPLCPFARSIFNKNKEIRDVL